MKVLQVNCVYKRGSTGKIVADIHKVLLERGIESVVCYGRLRVAVDNEKNVHKFCTEFEGNLNHVLNRFFGASQYGSALISTKRLISIIKSEKPDVVHLQCINGYCVNIYDLLTWLSKSDIKTVVTNHAEFFYTGSCGHAYECNKWTVEPGCGDCSILREASDSMFIDNTAISWLKMKNAYSNFKKEYILFTAVSPWVKSRFAQSPITNMFCCEVVENGLETSVFHRRSEKECADIRKKIGIDATSKMVFHATASFTLSETSLKGGRYIYEMAKRMPSVYFVVAALKSEQIADCPKNLILIGATETQDLLATLYSAANLTMIASRRETFSMITAETLCCGTPIVGFEAGGPESIALPEYSRFVEYSNVDALQKATEEMLSADFDTKSIENAAKARYCKETMTERYLDIYKSIIGLR